MRRIILLSYIFVISVGTLLLSLPFARTTTIPLIDLIFTSTACTCVTGLLTVPISYFTTSGKFIILCLIQIGGIGLLTLSLFFISLFLNLGMATKIMAGELFEFRWSNIKSFIITIVATTFVFELAGAIFFFTYFKNMFELKEAIFQSVFHSVSSFCNTGISLSENGISDFAGNIPFLLITAILIFVGSIGFIVWVEVTNRIRLKKHKFSLNTKLVFTSTAIIIAIGTTLTWLLERGNTLKDLPYGQGIFNCFFNTISLRSTGFELFDINSVMPATILLFMILMYIGGSPGSIAGGIKTTTLAIFVTTMATIVRNRDDVEIFGRRISQGQVYRAISIIVFTAAWILSITFLLLIAEKSCTFIQAFFEVISSFSLCGLKTKIASSFSVFGKTLIIMTMLVGRIGSLTLIFALRRRKKRYLYHYPEEQIVVG